MNNLKNLKELKLSMEMNDWMICSFLFCYKNIEYVVLVKRYSDNEIKPKYALVRLHFMRANDIDNALEAPANSSSLMIDAKTLRNYFQIELSKNLGELLSQFTRYLGEYIPTELPNAKEYSDTERNAIVKSLSQSDAEDPNKRYCYRVRRNPLKPDGKSYSLRSPFNSDKTKLLRPELYERLKEERNLSFCYSTNPNQDKTDEEIIYNWTQEKNR